MGRGPGDAQGNRGGRLTMAKGSGTRRLGTRLVTGGRRHEWTGAAVNPPVWRTSTHLYDDSADLASGRPNADGHFYYGRRGTPTQWALAEALTELETGAAGTVLYPSGVAAIAGALLTVLEPGDAVLITDNAYEPTRNLATGFLKRFGIEARFFDPLDIEAYSALFCPRTKAVMLESPGSLTMEVCDIPALALIARDKGATSVIDNTWASALGFPALARGCDIAVMSLTKHVAGHSDLMMGSASAADDWYRKLRLTAQSLGTVVSPDDASLSLRGLRTMGVRLTQSTAAALEIARWLETRPEVARVLCPMLPGAPGHTLWARDFTGGCGLFSIVLDERGPEARATLIDALDLFGIGYSWGGFESLVVPADPKRSVAPVPGDLSGEGGAAIRFSIGLEDPRDLIADLAQAFAAMETR